VSKRKPKAKKVRTRKKATQPTANELKKRQVMRNGHLVKSLLQTEVWKDILEQEISEMISHISGYQSEAGKWIAGHDSSVKATDQDLRYYSGYKAALIEFHINILKYVETAERANRADELNKKAPELIDPMVEDYNAYYD